MRNVLKEALTLAGVFLTVFLTTLAGLAALISVAVGFWWALSFVANKLGIMAAVILGTASLVSIAFTAVVAAHVKENKR